MDINSLQSSVQNMAVGLNPNAITETKAQNISMAQKGTGSQFAVEKASESVSASVSVSNKENVDSMLSGLNEQMQTLQSFLKFEKDEDNQKMVFFIKNSETGETIRQIPSQELLTISKNISKYLEAAQQPSDLSGKTPSPVGLITNQMV